MWYHVVATATGAQADFLLKAMSFAYSDGGPYDAKLVWQILALYPCFKEEYGYLPTEEDKS